MDTRKISCIILAGGKGNRMGGEDKGLIAFNGKPMIEHVLERIQPQVDDIVISANRHLERYKHYAARVVTDGADDYPGPLAGIAAALPECNHDYVLVVPCDMPALPRDLVTKLSAAMDGRTICIAQQDERLQLVFVIKRELIDSIDAALLQGHNKLMEWIQQQQPAVVAFTDADAFRNINSRDDLDDQSG